MAKGTVIQNGKTQVVAAESGENLLAVLRREGFVVLSPCGGNGTCGKCKVKARGMLSPLTETEKRFLTEETIQSGVRLACQTTIEGDFEIELFDAEIMTETAFRTASYEIMPLVRSSRTEEGVSFYIEDRLIGKGAPGAKNFGLAVDIGTTTVAVYLVDMDAGRVIGRDGFRNPQGAYGADVISRIDKIMKDKTMLAEEQQLVLNAIAEASKSLTKKNGGKTEDIRAAVFCGNTVMQHIAAGIDPTSIANAPFTAPTLFGEWYAADTLSLPFADGAQIFFAPCFASYVGGDIACGMIAAGLDHATDNVLFIDIGTNGEIGLSTEKGLYFCSAAAGPALEGAHIRCGMPGTLGAISKVFLDGEIIRYETIGNVASIGICGSGIIDACAVMLETGILDETGCISDAEDLDAYTEYLGEDWDGNTVFLIDIAREIYLSGKDIREIQLAKAAIAAGIRTLIRKAGLESRDIARVVLAGGFGSHINPASACRIGLIPREFEGKIQSVGNVAGAGAVAYLLSKAVRLSMETVASKSQYTELSGDAFFMDAYIDEMMFEE